MPRHMITHREDMTVHNPKTELRTVPPTFGRGEIDDLAPDKALLSVRPQDLERLFDSSSSSQVGKGAGRDVGSNIRLSRAFPASIGWDGTSQDSRPFSRFDELKASSRFVKRPVANTGARVVELEGHQPGGMFGRTATDPGRVQWTVEQETSRVLAHDSPFVERTKGSVALERPHLKAALAVVPKAKIVRPPTCIPRAGQQGDQALLTPQERRQMNDYEIKTQLAERVARKAQYQKTRLEFIEKHRFPEGIIGVDSPSNPASELYAEKRSITQRRENAAQTHATARRQRLDEIIGEPRLRFGFNPWQHKSDLAPSGGIAQGIYGDVTAACHAKPIVCSRPSTSFSCPAPAVLRRNGGEHFLQAKARTNDRTHHHQTTSEESNNDDNYYHRGARSQALWDEFAGRRRFDIVTGALLPLKTEKEERPPGQLAHSSQQSLERGRNLQGSILPV